MAEGGWERIGKGGRKEGKKGKEKGGHWDAGGGDKFSIIRNTVRHFILGSVGTATDIVTFWEGNIIWL